MSAQGDGEHKGNSPGVRDPKAYAPVAQLDRVSGYEPEGRGFESLLACQQKTA